MFERMRVPVSLLELAGVRSVGHAEAVMLVGDRKFDLGGIVFPCGRPGEDRPHSYVIRLDKPHEKAKYVRPRGENDLYFPPGAAELAGDTTVPLIFVESPKSVLALMSLAERTDRRWLVVATGGCDGWRCKLGVETAADGSRIPVTGPHHDLERVALKGRETIIAFDANAASNPYVHRAQSRFAAELRERGALVKIASVPARQGVNGPDDLIAVAGDVAALEAMEKARANIAANPWDAAEGMETFLDSGNDEDVLLHEPILFRERVTEIFSPRGIGKSLYALFLAVLLALKGYRIFLLDRDNSKRDVRKRLRSWGAGPNMKTLKVLARDKCPPLTRPDLWALFPCSEYDVVILDSLDSMAEGVGEQDSSRPSKAIAPLLDIVRRDGGPSVLVLGNTVRTGKHSRGSGVIEDRSDIAFEVRDLTDFRPSGNRPWWEELPPADAGSWAARATRRKQRKKYRLGFVPSKFRGDQEPDPFILELDLTTAPWSVKDVTDEVDAEGAAERDRRAREQAEAIAKATESLASEVRHRDEAGQSPMLKDRDAVPFIMALGLTRKLARELVNKANGGWVLGQLEGEKGRPIALFYPGKNGGGGNTTPTDAAKTVGENDADFRQPHPEPTAERHLSETPTNSGDEGQPISAADTILSPQAKPSDAAPRIVFADDDEVSI
jgi:hypothetical protein